MVPTSGMRPPRTRRPGGQITQTDQKVLDFVTGYGDDRRRWPTIFEIEAGCGRVRDRVWRMLNSGLLTLHPMYGGIGLGEPVIADTADTMPLPLFGRLGREETRINDRTPALQVPMILCGSGDPAEHRLYFVDGDWLEPDGLEDGTWLVVHGPFASEADYRRKWSSGELHRPRSGRYLVHVGGALRVVGLERAECGVKFTSKIAEIGQRVYPTADIFVAGKVVGALKPETVVGQQTAFRACLPHHPPAQQRVPEWISPQLPRMTVRPRKRPSKRPR